MIRKSFVRLIHKAKDYCVVLPCRIEGAEILLESLRSRDFEKAGHLFSEAFPALADREIPKRLPDIFQAVYLVYDRTSPESPVGFIGLYRITCGKSVFVSIMIDPVRRRQGYGRKALGLLLETVFNKGVASKVNAEVRESNTVSTAFFRAVGFKVRVKREGELLFQFWARSEGGNSES